MRLGFQPWEGDSRGQCQHSGGSFRPCPTSSAEFLDIRRSEVGLDILEPGTEPV
jgi:hypothetical protein